MFCPLASHAQDSKESPSPGHKTTTKEAAVVRIIVKNDQVLRSGSGVAGVADARIQAAFDALAARSRNPMSGKDKDERLVTTVFCRTLRTVGAGIVLS
jgi:hypothetical protein